jgi:hypothetical protein
LGSLWLPESHRPGPLTTEPWIPSLVAQCPLVGIPGANTACIAQVVDQHLVKA